MGPDVGRNASAIKSGHELVACLTKVGAIGVLAAEIHTHANEGSAISVLEKAQHESMYSSGTSALRLPVAEERLRR